MLLPDGRVKHVHALAHVLRDASGNREFVGAVTDVTERKTAEDKIRRLVEAGILGIFFANVEGEIVEANQAFLQMLQYGRQDLVSGRLRWADLTPAEWRESDERSLAEFLATGVFQTYEKEYFRKDGSRVPVLIGGARVQNTNEGVVFVLDLSEQKRAEEKIREQEAELRQMLDLAPQIIAVYGPNLERLYANRIALDYLGLSLEEWRQASELAACTFILMIGNGARSIRLIVLSLAAPLTRWNCDYAKLTEVIAGSSLVSSHCATNRDRLRVGILPRRT